MTEQLEQSVEMIMGLQVKVVSLEILKAALHEVEVTAAERLTKRIRGAGTETGCICHFCQASVDSKNIADHWRECEKHPANVEVQRLRQALAEYANQDNWDLDGQWHGPFYVGWKIAKITLERKHNG